MHKKHRFKFDKLIRDKIPENLKKFDISIFTKILKKEEYIKSLKNKLAEESQELIDAKTKNDIKEELADILEVIHAISKANDLSYEEIENARLNKREKKGGFERRIYGEYIEISSDNKRIDYYLSQPKNYPEIS